MFKRFIAASVAVALGFALSLAGATAAQAHTADFNVTAVCNTSTGNYDLTGHLTLASVPNGETGHVVYHVGGQSFSNNWNGSTFTFEGDAGTHGNGTFAFALPSIPGTTVGTGPWTYVYTTFDKGDTFTIESDNQATGLTGTCSDTPDSKKITFCHYDGSNDNGGSGKYSKIETSLAAFYNAGHIDHVNDIFPAGSVTIHGVKSSWAAQGDQSLLSWDDCLAVNAAAGISVSTPTCQSASVATWTGLVNATGGALDQTPGTHSGVATATDHHAFPAGAGVTNNGSIKTISYTIVAATSGSPCWPADATASVTIAPPTCTSGSVVTATPEAPAGGSVITSGPTSGPGTFIATFTAPTGHKFPAGPDVSADGSTFTITVQLLDKDTRLCPAVVPTTPVVKDLCGTDNDHYGLPTGPVGVTYSRDGKDIVATHGPDLQWGALPAGWTLNQDGTLTYAFSNTQWTDVPCGSVGASVAASASVVGQTCFADEESASLIGGSITVDLSTGHIDYTVTRDSDATHTPIPYDTVTGKTTVPLDPGSYTVVPTAKAGFELANPGSIPEIVEPYNGVCKQLGTHAIVDPSASQVQLGCKTEGSYTLTTDQLDPTAVVWTVNGSTVARGTHVVTAAGAVHVTAAPGPGFGFAGTEADQLRTWDFTFAAPSSCDLKTLALTGTTDGLPMLAASGMLLLLGVALVRSSLRIRRGNAAS